MHAFHQKCIHVYFLIFCRILTEKLKTMVLQCDDTVEAESWLDSFKTAGVVPEEDVKNNKDTEKVDWLK